MSRKYIKQINDLDFVYPNKTLAEYDVEIVHDINDNCVSGTVATFSATTASSTGITISYSFTWRKNNAEPFIRNSNALALWSLHMMAPGQSYYKPWRTVRSGTSTNLNATGVTNASSTTILPSEVGLTSFQSGTYYFEVRFIGHRCVYPVCIELDILSPPFPTATPTPTPTPTATAGPTPTPTATAPSVCCVSGVTLNVTDTGWIKFTLCNGTVEYRQYTTTGAKVISECIQQNTVAVGIPFADLAAFTVTGAGTVCGGVCVTPTPTPTPTATTPGGLVSFGGCGRGDSVSESCNDAGINNRTFYSDCDTISFGVGCYVYTDPSGPTALTGYSNVFMNFQNWDINSSTGQVTAYSSVQC